MKIFLAAALALCSSVSYASGVWVPFNQPQVVVQEQIITNTIVPIPHVPQPTVVYQLTPHVVFEKVTIRHRYVFREFEEVKIVPKTYWVPQHVIIYK